MKPSIYSRQSKIEAPVEEVFKWHSMPGAIERLSPPWDPLKIVKKRGGIEVGGRVVLRMKAGPFPYKWFAEHTRFEKNRMFRDEQKKGPFSEWIHTHRFSRVEENACMLEDNIAFKLPFNFLTGFLLNTFIKKKLEKIFSYRHRLTAADIGMHRIYREKPRKKVLITGASGLLGSLLVPFLTSGGHQVVKLVRKPPASNDEVFWNPAENQVDKRAFEKVDAVIHLAGENIGTRWTKHRKEKIKTSRVTGTALIARTIAGLENKPEVFICASAIGYYGDRCDCFLTEADEPGNDFLPEVCRQWENAAKPSVNAGIRTALLRIGVVLTPEGGALKELLPAFKVGLGGRIGTGKQFVSWISDDDVICAIYHVLMNRQIEGPVNAVAPNPVTNDDFVKTLGKVLRRPAFLPLNSRIIKLFFGEMGREVLLSSTRVKPEKLLETGFRFRYPQLESALRNVIGRDI